MPTRTTVVDFGATGWRYLAQPQTDLATLGAPAEADTSFAAVSFDDTGWTLGQAAFGWGFMGGVGLTPRNTTLTEQDEVWIRRAMPGGGRNYQVTIRIDNWAYAYFNGHRLDGPGLSPPYDAGVYWVGADNGTTDTTIDIPNGLVRGGRNVVALHVFDELGDPNPIDPTSHGGYGAGDVLLADMKVTCIPHLPRLRQFPRDDQLGHAPRQGRTNNPTSVQGSARQGWTNTYR